MKLELDFANYFCTTKRFSINDVKASYHDFGKKFDQPSASDGGCDEMQFTGISATPEVLEKYKITISEYNFIVGQLEVGLSFGSCGYCT